jgi:DNA-binding CsgD family transcriptional regulator
LSREILLVSIIEFGPNNAPFGPAALSQREKVVLAHLTHDATLDEIAARLYVSRNTVKTQIRSAYKKIGVSTRADAVAWSWRAGLRAAA